MVMLLVVHTPFSAKQDKHHIQKIRLGQGYGKLSCSLSRGNKVQTASAFNLQYKNR